MSKLHVIEQVQQYQCKPITVLLKVIMSRTWISEDKLFIYGTGFVPVPNGNITLRIIKCMGKYLFKMVIAHV